MNETIEPASGDVLRVGGAGLAAVLARAVDGILEATVAGSFTRIGIVVRRRFEWWSDIPRLDGKVVVVTGASSGIGRAVAVELARLGANLWLVGRDPERTAAAAHEARAASDGGTVETALLDVVDGDGVRTFADRLGAGHGGLDVLVHNAGALLREYREAPDGTELTVATQVLAPFRLSWCLHPLLRAAGESTIVTVASGGLYAERFDLNRLEMPASRYDGVRAYARAKRAQLVLSHEWARRWAPDGVASYATHPGWVDTPGLAAGLPSFIHLGPLLRSPAEGADTVAWLAAGGPRRGVSGGGTAAPQSDGLWHDRRRRRGEYHLPGTRPPTGEAAPQGARLWDWCAEHTGVGADTRYPTTGAGQ